MENVEIYPRKRNAVTTFKYNADANKFDAWKESISKAVKHDPRWGEYDFLIDEVCLIFNGYHRLSGSAVSKLCSIVIDPGLIKALIRVETGPDAPGQSWGKRPMQIGNLGDKGLDDVLGTSPLRRTIFELIVPNEYRYIDFNSVRNNPKENIIAGIAYILMSTCTFAMATFICDEKVESTQVTRELNNYSVIAKNVGTTVDVLLKMNPDLNPNKLHVGDAVKFNRAERRLFVYSIEKLDCRLLARVYNVNGDARYLDKLNFMYDILG